jgi:hypothetical protein
MNLKEHLLAVMNRIGLNEDKYTLKMTNDIAHGYILFEIIENNTGEIFWKFTVDNEFSVRNSYGGVIDIQSGLSRIVMREQFQIDAIVLMELIDMGMDLSRYSWACVETIKGDYFLEIIRHGLTWSHVSGAEIQRDDFSKEKLKDAVFHSVKAIWDRVAEVNFPEKKQEGRLLEWVTL